MYLRPDQRAAFEQVVQGFQAAVLLMQAVEHDLLALKLQIDRAASALQLLRPTISAENRDGGRGDAVRSVDEGV